VKGGMPDPCGGFTENLGGAGFLGLDHCKGLFAMSI
jgi:hypothetical protein